MKAKVFISCGQASADERKVSEEVASWLQSEGYEPYVAIKVQSICDLNAGIIGELKSSDIYLFINFQREKVIGASGEFNRGSVYTNQELAVAYALGFEKLLVINQKTTKKEGVLDFIVCNTPEFERPDEVLGIVKQAIVDARWSSSYSRHLRLEKVEWGPNVRYGDHTGNRLVRVLYAKIKNPRSDIGASDASVRLAHIKNISDGSSTESPDRSPLKVTGSGSSYAQAIFPVSEGSVDLLAVNLENQCEVFLNSHLDVVPRMPIIRGIGSYELTFEAFAFGFPIRLFRIKVELTGSIDSTTAVIVV
ncbi:hypothetical protein [Cerasicoccus fimbriatus]|uniref:hypothetical protein n=1 Tax=Cerasicoccus fimbriatus TaxID=3014554 RepID=UPI0022B4A28D|nr:hypothetical protein [Cerasicoccus sp. TK19100]